MPAGAAGVAAGWGADGTAWRSASRAAALQAAARILVPTSRMLHRHARPGWQRGCAGARHTEVPKHARRPSWESKGGKPAQSRRAHHRQAPRRGPGCPPGGATPPWFFAAAAAAMRVDRCPPALLPLPLSLPRVLQLAPLMLLLLALHHGALSLQRGHRRCLRPAWRSLRAGQLGGRHAWAAQLAAA